MSEDGVLSKANVFWTLSWLRKMDPFCLKNLFPHTTHKISNPICNIKSKLSGENVFQTLRLARTLEWGLTRVTRENYYQQLNWVCAHWWERPAPFRQGSLASPWHYLSCLPARVTRTWVLLRVQVLALGQMWDRVLLLPRLTLTPLPETLLPWSPVGSSTSSRWGRPEIWRDWLPPQNLN